ncbi:unnamed protein product [Meganyctiphanes norvegica]|uniref:Fibrinogen C-terminal domain-containing protein n=1 Tax=Meganyctiphanes norvegica TaxID=48144 RepID=A0AAV2R5T9_MEGNR
MKTSIIFVISFSCTLYVSERSMAMKLNNGENTDILPTGEPPHAIIETNTKPDMQREYNSEYDISDMRVEDNSDPDTLIDIQQEDNSDPDTSDMQRQNNYEPDMSDMQKKDNSESDTSDMWVEDNSDPGTSNIQLEDNSDPDTSDMQRKDNYEPDNSDMQQEDKPDPDTSDMMRKGGGGKKSKYPMNCLDLKKKSKSSGAYYINPCNDHTTKEVMVYCDMDTDGGGWTVIQRRDNYAKQQSFYNNWNLYASGFGDVMKDFWLGNDNIHCLTNQSHNEIRFDLDDWSGNTAYANYGLFHVDDRVHRYKLSVLNYTGNSGNSFTNGNNLHFSTHDIDNDSSSSNCASAYKGAWWYSACHHSNLNGLYNSTTFGQGVNWYHWKGYNYSLKKTEMKIRPKN